jgi:hypothetical protein
MSRNCLPRIRRRRYHVIYGVELINEEVAFTFVGVRLGTSIAQIIQQRREQFHTLRPDENLDLLNPPVNTPLTRGQAFFLQHNGDAVLSYQMALGVLGQSRAQQASSMAYFDVFSFSKSRFC